MRRLRTLVSMTAETGIPQLVGKNINKIGEIHVLSSVPYAKDNCFGRLLSVASSVSRSSFIIGSAMGLCGFS